MNHASLIFCTFSLIVTIGLTFFFYSRAIIPVGKLTGWNEPAHAEDLPDINISDFGVVSINKLIDYYIENPPAPLTNGNIPSREVRFKGC